MIRRPWVFIALVFLGYIGSCGAGWLTVQINDETLDPVIDNQSSGMVAGGEFILLILSSCFFSLIPTVALIWYFFWARKWKNNPSTGSG